MRILLASNSIWCSTGYGIQARHILRGLKSAGHEVAQFAFYGLRGGHLEVEGIPIYPGHRDPYGRDVIGQHAMHFRADVVMSLQDTWVLPENYSAHCGVPYIPYFPVDSIPPIAQTVTVAKNSDYPVVYSRFGLEQMTRAGVKCSYIPHGVDCEVFQPGDKGAARRALGWPSSAFIISMVAANKDYPSRKAFPENLQAFARFHARHPDSILYLHTDSNRGGRDGVDLAGIAQTLGIPKKAIQFPDQQRLVYGIPDTELATIYQASDVLLAASMSEGFGVPIVEAQAAGCPVITTNYSAMTEITLNGIAVEPAQLFWIPIGCWQAMVSVDGVIDAMEWIYLNLSEYEAAAPAASEKIKAQYDWPVVMGVYWIPFINQVQAEIKGNRVFSDRMRKVDVGGVSMKLFDGATSWTVQCVRQELEQDVYGLDRIDFQPGDTVIDIGANVGGVSIYLAKKYPFLRILAFEPFPDNYRNLERNLKLNSVTNVEAYNLAVTGDGRAVGLAKFSEVNSGGAGAYSDKEPTYVTDSITLDEIFSRYQVYACRLLKIDCEGAEYEILNSSTRLSLVDYIGAEFHMNDVLKKQGCSLEHTLERLSSFVPLSNVKYTSCYI